MEKACQEARLTNLEVMNIYDINPGQAVVKQTTLQIDLVENEDKNGAGKGETAWLALGLKLEESQCVFGFCTVFLNLIQ
jgi:hypothetical protein